MFRSDSLYVYDKRTNEIQDITDKVKGKLLLMVDGTSTVVNDKVINTCDKGTYAFYPKELRCEMLNEDLK